MGMRSAALAGLLLGMLAGPGVAEVPRPQRSLPAPRELTIVNQSRRPVFQLHISSTEADQWGDDRLGEATIPPGGSFRVRLGRTRECQFDVQVIYDDLSHEEQRGLDICRNRRVAFDGKAAIAPIDPFATDHEITIENEAPLPIRQVFVSSGAADQWGEDLAPAGGIMPQSEGRLRYHGACTADLRVVFDNRAAEERRGVDICARPRLAVRPGWTTAEEPPGALPVQVGEITLMNRTGQAITELFLSPDNPASGPPDGDVLGNAVLPPGGQLTVAFDRGRACRFNARIRHGGDREDQHQDGIDLCRSPLVSLGP